MTRALESPPASPRVASSNSSSGRRIERTSSVISASAATSASTPATATRITARRESERERLRAAAWRVRWRAWSARREVPAANVGPAAICSRTSRSLSWSPRASAIAAPAAAR